MVIGGPLHEQKDEPDSDGRGSHKYTEPGRFVVAGLSSAGIFAGYTLALSRATVPAIVDYGSNDEGVMLAQWRYQYVDGAAFSRPCCLINALSFGYLAYQAPNQIIRYIYVVAAVLSASGVPWALTALRRTNGALSIRTERKVGPYGEPDGQPVCVTYASNETASIARESKDRKYESSKALINRWKWHNDLRTAVLILGTVAGAFAVALE